MPNASKPIADSGVMAASMSQELRKWLLGRGFDAVKVEEDLSPRNDRNDDYELTYVVRFLPESASQAQLEFHVSDDGYVGFGLETWKRVATRMKVTVNSCLGAPDRFAAGCEPSLRRMKEVLLVLDLVSQGKVVIHARALPWLGLVGTRGILVTDQDNATIELCKKFRWSTSLRARLFEKTVRFDRWR